MSGRSDVPATASVLRKLGKQRRWSAEEQLERLCQAVDEERPEVRQSVQLELHHLAEDDEDDRETLQIAQQSARLLEQHPQSKKKPVRKAR